MAHFARLGNDNIVEEVLVVPDAQEHRGHDYLSKDLNLGGVWVQTSYNGTIRKNYAGIGYTYDDARDAFIPPKPFNSWTLNEETCLWDAPTPYPTDGKLYRWVEEDLNWQVVE
jgi:hypothetical protein